MKEKSINFVLFYVILTNVEFLTKQMIFMKKAIMYIYVCTCVLSLLSNFTNGNLI